MKYSKFFFGLVILILLLLFLFNINGANFWTFDFYKIVYLGILIFISFFLTQHYTDERKRKEYIIDMVDKLSNFTTSISLNKIIEDRNADSFNMEVRNIRNILDLLGALASKYDIEKEIEYLCKEINEIDDTVSENISKIENLEGLKKTIERHKNNVISKCFAIKFKIFFPDHKKKK